MHDDDDDEWCIKMVNQKGWKESHGNEQQSIPYLDHGVSDFFTDRSRTTSLGDPSDLDKWHAVSRVWYGS